MKGISQKEMILSYLQSGKKLTQLQALRQFNCLRLGARIWDLKTEGHEIRTELVNDQKSGKVYAEYSMS